MVLFFVTLYSRIPSISTFPSSLCFLSLYPSRNVLRDPFSISPFFTWFSTEQCLLLFFSLIISSFATVDASFFFPFFPPQT